MTTAAQHHSSTIRDGHTLLVAKPARDTSWWRRLQAKRRCARDTGGHCWHLERHSWLDWWWCCMCPAETEGTPDQECVYCIAIEERQRSERPYP